MNLTCFICKRRTQWSPALTIVCVECRAEMTDAEWEDCRDRMWAAIHSAKYIAKWGTRQNDTAGTPVTAPQAPTA